MKNAKSWIEGGIVWARSFDQEGEVIAEHQHLEAMVDSACANLEAMQGGKKRKVVSIAMAAGR